MIFFFLFLLLKATFVFISTSFRFVLGSLKYNFPDKKCTAKFKLLNSCGFNGTETNCKPFFFLSAFVCWFDSFGGHLQRISQVALALNGAFVETKHIQKPIMQTLFPTSSVPEARFNTVDFVVWNSFFFSLLFSFPPYLYDGLMTCFSIGQGCLSDSFFDAWAHLASSIAAKHLVSLTSSLFILFLLG